MTDVAKQLYANMLKGQSLMNLFFKIAIKLFEINEDLWACIRYHSEVNGYGYDHGYKMMIIALNHYKGTIVFGLRKMMTNGCYYVAPAINGEEYQGMMVNTKSDRSYYMKKATNILKKGFLWFMKICEGGPFEQQNGNFILGYFFVSSILYAIVGLIFLYAKNMDYNQWLHRGLISVVSFCIFRILYYIRDAIQHKDSSKQKEDVS